MKRAGPDAVSPPPTRLLKVLAWGVHFYTALGLVAAAAMAVLIVGGSGEAFRWVFLLMFIATIIDATDGTLARAVRIKETIPSFDGRRLDDIVDFLTYTFLPLFFLWKADIIPEGYKFILLLPLLASAYGFCQVSAKTDDGFFLGFPSYWNMIALYLYLLQPIPEWVTMSLIIVPAVLTFVPSRYLYPTAGGGLLAKATMLLGGIWSGLLVWILLALPSEYPSPTELGETWPRPLAVLSLFFPIFYIGASWFITCRIWTVRRRARKEGVHAALAPEK